MNLFYCDNGRERKREKKRIEKKNSEEVILLSHLLLSHLLLDPKAVKFGLKMRTKDTRLGSELTLSLVTCVCKGTC